MKFVVSKASWKNKEDGKIAPCKNAKLEKVVTIVGIEMNVWTVELDNLSDVLLLIEDKDSPPILLDRTSVASIPYGIIIQDCEEEVTITKESLENINVDYDELHKCRDINSVEHCPGCNTLQDVHILDCDDGLSLNYIAHCDGIFFLGIEGKYVGDLDGKNK